MSASVSSTDICSDSTSNTAFCHTDSICICCAMTDQTKPCAFAKSLKHQLRKVIRKFHVVYADMHNPELRKEMITHCVLLVFVITDNYIASGDLRNDVAVLSNSEQRCPAFAIYMSSIPGCTFQAVSSILHQCPATTSVLSIRMYNGQSATARALTR
eukprot:Rmarinus@m.24628